MRCAAAHHLLDTDLIGYMLYTKCKIGISSELPALSQLHTSLTLQTTAMSPQGYPDEILAGYVGTSGNGQHLYMYSPLSFMLIVHHL